MKCTQCFSKKCDHKHSNRHNCVGEEEGIKCSCICQISSKDASIVSAASVGTGAAVIAAGVGLTVLSGGVFAIIAGGSVICAGSSLALSPLKKRIIGEHLSKKDMKQEFIFGATVGALASPIGLLGTLATKGVSDVVRLRIKNRELRKNLNKEVECVSYKDLNEEFAIKEP